VIGDDRNKSVVTLEISVLETILKLDKDGTARRPQRSQSLYPWWRWWWWWWWWSLYPFTLCGPFGTNAPAAAAGRRETALDEFDATRKMLSVTLDNIKHLPKTDTFGKCDSYVLLELGTHSQKSKVRTRVPCEHCTLHMLDLQGRVA
jgi:hypothetical protein